MGLGNGKKNAGNQGSNFSYELKSLLQLQNIVNTISGAIPTPGGLASEVTLQAVLSAIDTMRDYEVRLVVDEAAPDPVTWLEVRYWDAQTGALGAPQYYLPGSTTPGTPTGSISYINQQTLLNQILSELQTISNAVHLETDDDYIAIDQVLPTNINLLYGAYDGEGYEWNRITIDSDGKLQGVANIESLLSTIDAVLDAIKLDSANLDVALSTRASELTLQSVLTELQGINLDTNGLSQEATQLLVKGVLDAIKIDTGALVIDLAAIETELLAQGLTLDAVQTATEGINTKLTSVERTPSFTRITGASSSSVAAGARAVSFANLGLTDATVLGSILSPGAQISFSAGAEEDTLGSFAYSTLAGNTELLITTIV